MLLTSPLALPHEILFCDFAELSKIAKMCLFIKHRRLFFLFQLLKVFLANFGNALFGSMRANVLLMLLC